MKHFLLMILGVVLITISFIKVCLMDLLIFQDWAELLQYSFESSKVWFPEFFRFMINVSIGILGVVFMYKGICKQEKK